jgi:hypothetical protein
MSSSTDPAHPSNANENHTTASGEKPKTAYTAVTDSDFLPTLDDAPVAQHAKSHGLLLFLVVGAVFSAWFMGFELFQPSENSSWIELGLGLGAVTAAGMLMLYWTGSHYVDWWELVSGYWWLRYVLKTYHSFGHVAVPLCQVAMANRPNKGSCC